MSSAIATATDPLLTVLDGVDSLNLDPAEVADTAAHLSSGVKTATDRIAALNIDHQQAAAIIDQVVGGLRSNADPAVRDLGDTLAGAQRMLTAHGMDPTTAGGLARLGDNAQHLQDQLSDPNSSLRTLITGTLNGQLRSDVIRLRNGATDLDTGANRLSAGLVALTNGAYRLTDGATALAAGRTTAAWSATAWTTAAAARSATTTGPATALRTKLLFRTSHSYTLPIGLLLAAKKAMHVPY